jgi:GWxTD domain-containing protein
MQMIINSKKIGCFCVIITGLIICGGIQKATAQRARFSHANEYQRLAYIHDHPPIYFNDFLLPGAQKGQVLLATTFKINYKRLAFKKMKRNTAAGSFYSPVSLTLDVFHSSKKKVSPYRSPFQRRFYQGSKNFKRNRIDVSGLTSIAHTAWKDTAFSASYSQTQSPDKALNGSMQVKVQPGYYIYLIKPAGSGKTHENQGITRRVRVTPYNKPQKNNAIFVKSVKRSEGPDQLNLINMGHRVIFGKDFYAFIHLPHFKEGTSYKLAIDQVQINKKDTSNVKEVYKQAVSGNDIIVNVRPVLHSDANGVSLVLQKEPNSYTYALIKIPNHKFINAAYKLTLTNTKTSRPAVVDYYQSYWQNMPASLLNLKVAINMLRYIASKQAIQNINNGSLQQREQKFRKFWKAKDPTPNTPFNELEAEYYARIDSAYKKFTTQDTPGYKTSRGKVYIIYGPPEHKQRTFPTNGPTTIIWTYPSRKFVFKATSNFGDFKLVKNDQ